VTLHNRILELLAAGPDDGEIAIHIQPADLPAGFVLPRWVMTELATTGQAIVAAVADRPLIMKIQLWFPGARLPLDIPVTPQN
jgi:hypothetical protein